MKFLGSVLESDLSGLEDKTQIQRSGMRSYERSLRCGIEIKAEIAFRLISNIKFQMNSNKDFELVV